MVDQRRQERFLSALDELGGSAGNQRLREALGWAETTYESVKAGLIEEGVIVPGRGRGGSVARATQPAPAEVAPPEPAEQVQAPAAPRRPEPPAKTATNVGYEAELWRMADALRGSMDAA
jgi:type I restriction enzyme M protein